MSQEINFLEGHGAPFPKRSVVVISKEGTSEEKRHQLKCLMDPSKNTSTFNLTDPVYTGDILELEDPRGGAERLYVTDVTINDHRKNPNFARFSCLEVVWSKNRPASPQDSINIRPEGTWIQVTGSGNQIALGNDSVSQSAQNFTISAEYSELANTINQALSLIEDSAQLSKEDKVTARESSEELLEELSTSSPDRNVLNRSLAAIKGILGTVLITATETGSKEIVQNLFEHLQLP